MRKFLSFLIVFISFATSANAICILGNCEAKEKCRNYAKSIDGDSFQKGDAYDYCMEREYNIKNYGRPLDDFIKQNQ